MKNLPQATEIRRRVLEAFEIAERETHPEERRRQLTFIVIGGGPTGVELAGAIGEMSRYTLARDFRSIDPRQTRVILVEAGPRILTSFDDKLAARAMRFVLTDHARRRAAEKRGGDRIVVTFDEALHQKSVTIDDVVALDDALTRLEDLDTRQANVIECRFFAGLSVEETAEVLGTSVRTVEREWTRAKAYLCQSLREGGKASGEGGK